MNIQLSMKGEDKRSIILKATMELITEHGFHATPMSMIAKHAGVAAGTIYNYFPSKDVLINQLYGELKQKMGKAIQENEVGAGGNLRDRFFHLYQNLFTYFTESPEEFKFLEQYTNSPLIRQAAGDDGQKIYEPVTDFLTGGIELGVLRNLDIRLMTSIVYGHVVSTAKLHLSGELLIDETQLKQCAQSCFDSVKIN